MVTTWLCPKCKHTEQQPSAVKAVTHLCGIGKRPVRLQPAIAINENER